MDSVIQVQILNEAACVSFHVNVLWKCMNSSILLLSMSKLVEQIVFFVHGWVSSLEEKL